MRHAQLSGPFAQAILAKLAEVAPSPLKAQHRRLGSPTHDEAFHRAYAKDQYLQRLRTGMGMEERFPDVIGKKVLEIGCGHGGISVFLAAVGAVQVVGIDVNDEHLKYGREFAHEVSSRGLKHVEGNVRFEVMDCHSLTFEAESFDLVLADNLFEHVVGPKRVLEEVFRVLKPEGILAVPTFSSIWSKHGLHLKNGLRVPWANLVFSESTIVEVVKQRAGRDPSLYDAYPGLRGDPQTVRELRKHKDLNQMTHAQFVELALATGFRIEMFRVHATPVGRILAKLRGWTLEGLDSASNQTLEVLSTGAAALLVKPKRSPRSMSR